MVVKAKRKAYIKLKRYHTEFHLLDYRTKRDISKNTLLRVKKEYWEHFCSQLTYKTNSRILWQQIKKFNGKPFKPVSSLVVNNIASMTFRRKPFRRMRLSIESDITSNATIRKFSSKDNSSNGHLSKFCRKFVEIWSKNEIMRN